MQITENIEGGVAIIALEGNLMTDEDSDALQNRVDALGLDRVVLKLRGIHMISSRGISALLVCAKNLRTSGGDLRLADLTDRAYHILVEVTQLGTNFQIFNTVDEAVASFAENQ